VSRGTQAELFPDSPALPEGYIYRPEFLTVGEERALLADIAALPLHEAKYKAYTARRRIAAYGFSYDYDGNRLATAPPPPDFLQPLKARVAAWLSLRAAAFAHVLVTEYPPGTPIGWHRDTPEFEIVAGISLKGWCRMRLRPYPHVAHANAKSVEIALAPRSIYILRGPARWQWQHHIPPTEEHRYSITLRTLAQCKGTHSRGPPEPTI